MTHVAVFNRLDVFGRGPDPRKHHTMRFIAVLISSVVVSAGVLTACGGANQSPPPSVPDNTAAQSSATAMPPTTPSSPAAQPAGSEIVISNFAYTVPASVSPGQQLTIVNNDSANHTVTSDANNVFDTVISGGGGMEPFTAPTTPGTYAFHCKYHANMHGSLVVQ
jgi:plastocyanin